MKTRQLLKNIIPLALMTILCFVKPSGLAVPFAILYMLIEKFVTKTPFSELGLNIKGLLKHIQKYWWLMLLPVVSGITAVILSKFLVPEFFAHVLERTKPILVMDKLALLIPQLLILALGEEIAFRAFMQGKLAHCIKPVWAIGVTSLVFALAHLSPGAPLVVAYDVLFVFIDSLFYGALFYKTNNVYVCTISHFIANLVGILIIMLF
ncbi:CPBP family intramembrane glutamic endopeptidase [Acetanaerobacterium elongatum]|uniref:CAAX protease self-immunity n=1 Tax=Acetanaerobacterium elongatum TaxID=258515 RepID=A0A1G9V6L6_9FIRM|nr:CPBP family intramembrane glutamic endopeptidase [Acetanaerobacterium elongatum]SDM67707.1 CAAX protease self-immunity [Acetanaerobacterium elongatum]